MTKLMQITQIFNICHSDQQTTKLIIVDDLHLEIIECISPKASIENSSAQWGII